jgi:hypothetical protein
VRGYDDAATPPLYVALQEDPGQVCTPIATKVVVTTPFQVLSCAQEGEHQSGATGVDS